MNSQITSVNDDTSETATMKKKKGVLLDWDGTSILRFSILSTKLDKLIN